MSTEEVENTQHEEMVNVVGPGARLRLAREASGLEIDDVADFLRLRPQLIEEIEQDDYRSTHEMVFLRGYLRAYAKHVGLCADEIISLFNEIYLDESPSVQLPASTSQSAQLTTQAARWTSYAIFGGIMVLTALWWHSQKASSHRAVASAPSVQQQAAASGSNKTQNNQTLKILPPPMTVSHKDSEVTSS